MVSPTFGVNLINVFGRGDSRIARPNNAYNADGGTFVNVPYNYFSKRLLFIKQRNVVDTVSYTIRRVVRC